MPPRASVLRMIGLTALVADLLLVGFFVYVFMLFFEDDYGSRPISTFRAVAALLTVALVAVVGVRVWRLADERRWGAVVGVLVSVHVAAYAFAALILALPVLA